MKKGETAIICPICLTPYITPEAEPNPTCGKPSCIREARKQGLAFVPVAKPPKIKPKGKKRAAGGAAESPAI